MSDDQCMICCEHFTKSVRKKVECGHCGTSACATCFAQYLLGLQGEPHCMNNDCRKTFDREFLAMHLTKTWLLTKYKAHRERVLLEREMALLPASQEVLQNYKYAQTVGDELAAAAIRRRELQQELNDLNMRHGRLRLELDVLRTSNYARRAGDHPTERDRRQFVRACPMPDCRGFLSTAWKCGTCDTWVCKDCGEPKLEGQHDARHVCDDGVKASFALLQKDSRPCPQCAAMIFKIDGEARRHCVHFWPREGVPPTAPPASLAAGCDQMFCTQCHVAFSWRTGLVVTNGVIHNPHYYAWLRQTRGEAPRNPGDIPCGGIPDAYELERALRSHPGTIDEHRGLRSIHRALRHLQHVDLPRLRNEARTGADRNVDLRLQYLLNRVDQEEWRRKLQQREKRRERSFAVMQVYDMFCAAAGDLYRAYADGACTATHCLTDLRQLQSFADDTLARISDQFNMRVKRLRD